MLFEIAENPKKLFFKYELYLLVSIILEIKKYILLIYLML